MAHGQIVRDLSLNDLVLLEKDAKFPLPNLSSPLYVIKSSVIEDNKLIGSFWVKLTSETSLILNSECSKFQHARAINTLFNNLHSEVQKLGLDDSHLFIENDDHFVQVLKNRFNFKDNLGTALYIGKGSYHG